MTLRATYRLQLGPDLGFAAAAELLPYLRDLGVSHLYLSPIAEACAGSTHGYDVVDPRRIRDELGGPAAFAAMADAAHENGLGILLDIVPNHMAAHVDNPFWCDVLRHGRDSRWARVFDVDWEAGGGRLQLPVLGAPLAELLAGGALAVQRDGDDPAAWWLHAEGQRWPLAPASAGAAERCEHEPSADALTRLLAGQHYELHFWREGLERINYRRFFDVADLVGVRVEDPEVMKVTHEQVV
ncbi:MAG: alpha-amylase family glycosyl hydrolase, partial [Planctomycetota bacterium]